MNENVRNLLNMFAKNAVDLWVDQLNDRLQDQSCDQYFRSVQLSVSKSSFYAGARTPCLKEYVENGKSIHFRPKLRNLVQRVFICDKFEASERMQNSFVLIAGVIEERSVPWVAEVLLLFRIRTQIDSCGTDYFNLSLVKCSLALMRLIKSSAVCV